MSVLDELRRDHGRLRTAIARLASRPWRAGRSARLADELARHFQLEEDLLFREIEQRLPEARQLLAELRAEHRAIEKCARLTSPSEESPGSWLAPLHSALSSHVIEEEGVLFEFAARLIDGDRLAELGAAFRSAVDGAAPACAPH